MCKSCAYSVSFFRDILCLCCVREISFNLLSLKDEYLENKTRYQESESDLKVYTHMKSVFFYHSAPLRPRFVSVHKPLLYNNSSYPTRPHSIIV